MAPKAKTSKKRQPKRPTSTASKILNSYKERQQKAEQAALVEFTRLVEQFSEHLSLTDPQRRFLAAYSLIGNVSRAADTVGCSRKVHYDWINESVEYTKAFEDAGRMADDHLEEEARRRAVDGVKRLKFFNGIPVIDPFTGLPYYEHEYSDTLLIFLMKGRMPGKYKENHVHLHKGDKASPIQVNHAHAHVNIDKLPLDLRQRLLEEIRRQKALPNGLKELPANPIVAEDQEV